MEIKVSAIKCLACGDIVYSRANHDFHRCTCGLVFVDGGNWQMGVDEDPTKENILCGYHRVGGEQHNLERVEVTLFGFDSFEEASFGLYHDWNTKEGHFGHIKIGKGL